MMNDAWLTDSLEILQSGRSPSPPSPDGVAEAVESHRAPRRIRSMHGFICPVCFAELPTNHELTTHYEHEHAICGAGGLPGRQCESGDGLNASGAGPSWKPQALGVHRKLMVRIPFLASCRERVADAFACTMSAIKLLCDLPGWGCRGNFLHFDLLLAPHLDQALSKPVPRGRCLS